MKDANKKMLMIKGEKNKVKKRGITIIAHGMATLVTREGIRNTNFEGVVHPINN